MRVATLDIGTNSVLLLVAERQGASAPIALAERCTITRLGKGVDEARSLDPAAVDRTLACLSRYAAVMSEFSLDRRAAVATSAVRDASGAASFLDAAETLLGVRPAVIDGPTEARMTFSGALAGLPVTGPVYVFDIGGGSTEIVAGFVEASHTEVVGVPVSLDVGAVRMTERHIRHDPPLAADIEAIRLDVRASLASLAPPQAGGTWVGIGGTVTTLSAMELRLGAYDSGIVHGHGLTRESITAWVESLAARGLDSRRSISGLDPARADVITAGAVIADEILAWAKASRATVSDRGVRWGLALELFRTR